MLVWIVGRKFGIGIVVEPVKSRTGGPARPYRVLVQGGRASVKEVNHFNLRPMEVPTDDVPTVSRVGARVNLLISERSSQY